MSIVFFISLYYFKSKMKKKNINKFNILQLNFTNDILLYKQDFMNEFNNFNFEFIYKFVCHNFSFSKQNK